MNRLNVPLFCLFLIAASSLLAISGASGVGVIKNVPAEVKTTRGLASSAVSNTLEQIRKSSNAVKRSMSLRGRQLQDDTAINAVVRSIRTIDQLTETFRSVLDQDFDFTVLDRAATLAQDESDLFFMVAGEEGQTLATDLAIAGRQLANTEIFIRSLAQTILGNAANVNSILSVVDAAAAPGSPVEGLNTGALTIALNLLSTTLQQFETDARRSVEAFEELGETSARLNTRALSLSRDFIDASQENSRVLEAAANNLRETAYSTCGVICGVTCVTSLPVLVLQPLICGGCIGGCFGPAVAVVETEQIPALQEQFSSTGNTLNEFATTFETFAEIATALGTRATQDIDVLESVRSDFAVAENLISSTTATANPLLLTLVPVVETIQRSIGSIEVAANLILERFVSEFPARRLSNLPSSNPMEAQLQQLMMSDSILANTLNFKVEKAFWDAVKNAHIAQAVVEKIQAKINKNL